MRLIEVFFQGFLNVCFFFFAPSQNRYVIVGIIIGD